MLAALIKFQVRIVTEMHIPSLPDSNILFYNVLNQRQNSVYVFDSLFK